MNELREITTIGDALSEGGSVALQGMVIVFSVLILLMIVLYLMRVIFYKDPNKAKKAEPQKTDLQEQITEVKEDEVDNDELIAVLTAAVAASLNTSTYNLKIKSYRRVGGRASAWNRAGLEETVNHY